MNLAVDWLHIVRAAKLMGRSEERVELVVREASVEEEGADYPPIRQRAGSLPGGHTRKYRPRTFSQVWSTHFQKTQRCI